MNDKQKVNDPSNRVVSTFDAHSDALKAKEALLRYGFDEAEIQVLHGEDGASEVDTSAKWFADTDEEMKKYARELHDGATIVSALVRDCDCRNAVHQIVKSHNARHVTHFGEWITEVMG